MLYDKHSDVKIKHNVENFYSNFFLDNYFCYCNT